MIMIIMITMIIMIIVVIMNAIIIVNIMMILIEHLHHQKSFFCVCMYKMLTYSITIWINIARVEVIKYNGKKWINENNLETALGCKNLVVNKTRYYYNEFRKRRDEIQDCEDFQPCRKLIAEELAVHLIIDTKTVKTAELKTKLGFNQVDPIISKQESTGLRLKKLFQVKK